MTPEQLQQYVDAALKQRDHFSLVFYPLVAVLSIGGAWLLSYLREKGKNLATKEDVAEITTTVESIKADLAAKQHFSRLRYEREMTAYQEVWKAVVALKDATLALRPPMAPPTKPDEKKQCWDTFKGAFDKLWEIVDANRPFYPEEIWKEFRELLDICRAEGWDFQGRVEGERWSEWYGRAITRMEQITNKIETLAEVIRKRLDRFD